MRSQKLSSLLLGSPERSRMFLSKLGKMCNNLLSGPSVQEIMVLRKQVQDSLRRWRSVVLELEISVPL